MQVRTLEILQHLSAAHALELDARAAIGGLLAEQKKALGHGNWEFYVADELSFSASTVKRAIQLHHFAEGHPERFEKLRPLGLTKAYILMALSPAKWDAFFAKDEHAVRRHVLKTPLRMTIPEMMTVLHGEPDVAPAPVRLVKKVKRFAKGILTSVKALLKLPELEESDELLDSLDIIADETKQIVTLLPASFAPG